MNPKFILFVCIILIIIALCLSLYFFMKNEHKDKHKESTVIRDLKKLHKKLKLKYGTFDDEFPEQVMAYMFIDPSDTVLEIGANIGRNTLIIAEILNDDTDLVTLESDPVIAQQLNENKNINNMNFSIISKALSKTPLIQKGWECIPYMGDGIPDGYKLVDTVKLDEIKRISRKKFFTTLVLDCEGAFYYILRDFPEILDGVKTIIMENDYKNFDHKVEINNKLLSKGFKPVYQKKGGWGPCEKFFFETWKKMN